MTKRELACIKQRVAVGLNQHEDAKALVKEVDRLRASLIEVRDMAGDPAIINTIDLTLED